MSLRKAAQQKHIGEIRKALRIPGQTWSISTWFPSAAGKFDAMVRYCYNVINALCSLHYAVPRAIIDVITMFVSTTIIITTTLSRGKVIVTNYPPSSICCSINSSSSSLPEKKTSSNHWSLQYHCLRDQALALNRVLDGASAIPAMFISLIITDVLYNNATLALYLLFVFIGS